MRIEKVSPQPDRSGRYTLRFDDGSVLRLYRQTMEDFGICAGMELSEETLVRLRTASSHLSAKMRAVRIVSAASVSKNDLERRLIQKGEDPAEAKAAVQWMADMDLLDDARMARQVAERCAAKGYGVSRARQALYEKRVPKEYWEEALADYPDQTEHIVAFLQAKLGDHWDQKDLHRAIDGLLRRGHTYPQIRRGLEILSVCEDLPEE